MTPYTQEIRGAEEQAADINAEKAGHIVRALDRAIRSRRLYAPGNPTLLHHQQELMSLLTRYLAEEDELTFLVEPFELKMEESTVYKNTNQQESFAFRLFSDGIRSITFRSGLTDSEITEFLLSISTRQTDQGTGNADAVTLFWEKEFEHIRYGVADSIVEEPTLEQKSTGEKIKELLDLQMTMYQGGGGGTLKEEDFYKEFKITLDPTTVGQMFHDRCTMAPEELGKIQADLTESDKPERLVLDFVDMVLAVLQEERDPKEYDRIAESLGGVLDHSFLAGKILIARRTMEEIHAFPTRATGVAKSDPTFLKRTLKILWPPSRIDLLIQTLNQEKIGSLEDVETLLSLTDPTVLPHLLKQLDRIVDLNRRKVACRGIARLHKGDLGIFIPLLSSKEPETVRTGLYILSLLKHEKVVDLLPALIAQQNPTIRKEAISILRNFRNPKGFRILVGLLHDPSEEIRILSLRILAGSNDRELARGFLNTINRKDFRQKSMQERKAYFHAVAKIVGDDFLPFLQDVLKTRNWFGSQELNDMYQCAIFALSVLGTPLAKEILQKAAETGNKTVRKHSEAALRLIERPTGIGNV